MNYKIELKICLMLLFVLFVFVSNTHAIDNCFSSSNLVSWWAFENNTNDIKGLNNAELVSNVGYSNGIIGSGIQLQNGGIVEINDSQSLQLQRFTVSAWVRPDGPGPNDDAFGSVIVLKALPYSGTYLPISLFWSNSTKQFTFVFGSIYTDKIVSRPIFTSGKFYHVAATYDGSTFKLYVNGKLESAQNEVVSISYDATQPWNIGSSHLYARNMGYPRTWNGVIDEVNIHDRALSQDEINSIIAQTMLQDRSAQTCN